jgi:cytidine deaminase
MSTTPSEATLLSLCAAARAARAHAYAPYSRFQVGAALLDELGRVHAGCNIENAAYPQGLCAEAVALAHLVLAGGRRVVAAAVVGEADQPVTPCGGCRQKLREFALDACPVWSADAQGVTARHTLGELLPASFGPAHLGATHTGAAHVGAAHVGPGHVEPDHPGPHPP